LHAVNLRSDEDEAYIGALSNSLRSGAIDLTEVCDPPVAVSSLPEGYTSYPTHITSEQLEHAIRCTHLPL